ncbi:MULTISPECIES: DUF4168 domain-containing protein [unclassified Leeuwenhoekiella]|uniref:DUF4168 domain-containing protein n=1 Tax=unclassified Leeuwenhoekiella TaxID=2615029 RepID=UPI000C3FCFFD|nr:MULTISPECIES: DUF4168 domain-containing protein [unclassified Leeuwenhoekiella]MAW94579.1 hypothetical protein [Leeuwenhoekiella sp.]MBA82002.1 hypothetical protein [Leeuwenhoekiella sp.]|tara:strand:- start:20064 stop:20570 length:507 start_codon:yes stop_codon:yes gene_type:complete
MITFKKNIISLALTGALLGGFSLTAKAQQADAVTRSQDQVNVTPAELNNFADAFVEVQTVNQTVKQKMMTVITEEGLEVERFNTIQKSKMNPEVPVEASEEELKIHGAIVTKLQEMQPLLVAQMKEVIEDHNLSFERYREVAMALQQSKDLQKRFQDVMSQKQTNTEG